MKISFHKFLPPGRGNLRSTSLTAPDERMPKTPNQAADWSVQGMQKWLPEAFIPRPSYVHIVKDMAGDVLCLRVEAGDWDVEWATDHYLQVQAEAMRLCGVGGGMPDPEGLLEFMHALRWSFSARPIN